MNSFIGYCPFLPRFFPDDLNCLDDFDFPHYISIPTVWKDQYPNVEENDGFTHHQTLFVKI